MPWYVIHHNLHGSRPRRRLALAGEYVAEREAKDGTWQNLYVYRSSTTGHTRTVATTQALVMLFTDQRAALDWISTTNSMFANDAELNRRRDELREAQAHFGRWQDMLNSTFAQHIGVQFEGRAGDAEPDA